MEILQNPPESNEIQFLEDGSWRPMEVEIKKEPHFLSPPTPNSTSINLGEFGIFWDDLFPKSLKQCTPTEGGILWTINIMY